MLDPSDLSANVKHQPLYRLSCRVWGAILVAILATLLVRAIGPDLTLWDVSDPDQEGQLTVLNSNSGGGHFGLPVELGDYDGDGHVDLVLGPMAANSGPNRDRVKAGEVYVYPGTGEISGVLDRSRAGVAESGLTVLGARPYDFTGTELYSADINGDGIEDLLISAQNYGHVTGPGPNDLRVNCGAVYVVFGRPGLYDDGPVIDLADLDDPEPPEGVLRLVGAEPGERFGIWVEAGDLDGDGTKDLLVGADQWPVEPQPGDDRFHAGAVYVIYGRPEFPSEIDLATFDEDVSIVIGRDSEDHFGGCVHSRDLDGNGFDELIVGAAIDRLSASEGGISPFDVHASAGGSGPNNRRFQCGEVYVLSHDEEFRRLPPVLDLGEELSPEVQSRLTLIYGFDSGGKTGEEIASGDFDGDGFTDLVLGTITADAPDGTRYAGAAHVVYWQEGLGGLEIDLADDASEHPEGVRVSGMFGINRVDILGDTISAADFNHDGFDDIAIGIPHHDGEGRSGTNKGLVAVVFGSPNTLPELWTPQSAEPPEGVRVAFVLGASEHDLLSYSMEARDVDGDGYADLFPNSMRGDGAGDRYNNAGEATLISGFHLSGVELGVSRVSPEKIVAGVPATLELIGDGFTTDEDTRVLIGDQPASAVRVENSQSLQVDVPALDVEGDLVVRIETRHGSFDCTDCLQVSAATRSFVRGDADRDGSLALNDAVFGLLGLFAGGDVLCADAVDSNDDGRMDVSDAVYSLNYLFIGGPEPRAPFPEPGPDLTDDDLDCDA